MSYVQWEAVGPETSNKTGKLEYLRLKSGNTYRVRPLYYPVDFYKYFHRKDGRLRTAIVKDPRSCPVRAAHSELNKPSKRYAILVLDRTDNSKVKILEAPLSVFKPLRDHYNATGKKPGGGNDGSDWQIKVEGQKLSTNYSVIYLADAPLTDDEKAKIKDAVDGDQEILEKIYAADDPETIEKKLFGEWNSNNPDSSQAEEEQEQEDNFDIAW